MKKMIWTMLALGTAVFVLTALLTACSCGCDSPAATSATTSTTTEATTDGTTALTTAGTVATTAKPTVTTTGTPSVTDKPSETTGSDVTTTAPTTTTFVPTTTATPSSSTAGSDETAPSDTTADTAVTTTAKPIIPLAPTTEKADESGKIFVDISDVKEGLLLDVDATHPYDATVNTLFKGDQNTTVEVALKSGFAHISTKFKTINNNHFLRQEALEALALMIEAFDAVACTDKPFRVEGYTASMADDLTNEFVTGNLLLIKTLVNDYTVGLNYSPFKVDLDGTPVTYDKWFAANAAKFGFVYEGLVGEENSAAGKLRYVGLIHAAGVAKAGSFDAYLAAVKAGTIKDVTIDGETWEIHYVKVSLADGLETKTEITVGANVTYTLSGDNNEGVIVAVKQVVAESLNR